MLREEEPARDLFLFFINRGLAPNENRVGTYKGCEVYPTRYADKGGYKEENMNNEKNWVEVARKFVVNGSVVVVINTTPHPVRFLDPASNEPVEVPSAQWALVNAQAVEVPHASGQADLVSTRFVGTNEGAALVQSALAWAHRAHPDARVRIVGSIIAAQAYKEQVVGMTPVPGYERVPPAQKLMRVDKFTAF